MLFPEPKSDADSEPATPPRPGLQNNSRIRAKAPGILTGLGDGEGLNLKLATETPPPLSMGAKRTPCGSPFRLTMPTISPGQLAFSATQFLPVPVLVLDSLKTVVLANEAMGRLLGLMPEAVDEEEMVAVMERLRGQSLSQVGVDMMQDGRLIWIDWEQFLDHLVAEMRPAREGEDRNGKDEDRDDATLTQEGIASGEAPSSGPKHNACVEVVISRKDLNRTTFDSRVQSKTAAFQAYAKMIITVWEVEDHQTYFTLTFTNTDSTPAPLPPRRPVARPKLLETAERKSISFSSNPPSVASSMDSSSPAHRVSPGAVSLTSSPFPPLGPPSKSSISSAPSILQKIIMMKDALLDNTQTPILAMWKDGSVTFPNKAARKLFNVQADFDKSIDGFDLLPAWTVWTEDFTRQLDPVEFPISVLIRTETPFSGMRIGMKDSDGNKIVFDVLGEALRDDHTGEFLAGVVTCRDVTKITQEIVDIKAADEERFRLMCDTMPQLVWTTTPEGLHDFFNSRWYTYTGLSEEESLGLGWKNPFHPDDMPETVKRWQHSLKTGEPYVTEYRCRSKEGEWRWFLGRALPLRNKQTGKIERWFGTCTDVNETMEARLEASRLRQQLLSVIAHSHVTIFTVDLNRCITMVEGALIWNSKPENDSSWCIGENVYKVFNRLNPQLQSGQMPQFLQPLEAVITGRQTEGLQEHEMDGKWYRTRFLPVLGKDAGKGGAIEGVIGLIMDVTELKAREADLETQAREKRQLVANEAAAKEASRLKSQFLANMSHEIRTPITGVIGMAEILLDDPELSEEQREYAENIDRSANALLTVINDILDFSKVESGRLDIEEVQFSLSVIVKDVKKMLSFAAERKNLDFQSNVASTVENDLVVLGDPGRVRQIITNLLTNSIKFTNQGYVKFSVLKERETADKIEIRFVIEDSGVGIEEEVRKKLFQPFSQGDASTARKFGGTGLGLTICKNLLELMNGRMALESTIGQGTTATFYIPFHKPQGTHSVNLVEIDALPDRLASEMSVSCNSSEYEQWLGTPPGEMTLSPLDKSKSPRRPSSLSTSVTGRPDDDLSMPERARIHILVVEDNAINQQIAIKTIKKLGFQVTAAWNGKEALSYLTEAAEGKKQKPDIILMDVQMPIIDGYKCTHLLRRHLPYKNAYRAVPIVAMTASAIQGDREKCEKAGMDDYLAKPVKSKILEKMLVRWSIYRRDKGHVPLASGHARGSEVSEDCSVASEHCDNADIPGVWHDDHDATPIPPFGNRSSAFAHATSHSADDAEECAAAERATSLPTPRPLAKSDPIESLGHFPGYTLSPEPSEVAETGSGAGSSPDAELMHPIHRVVTDEVAQHSRDDKLLRAAGGTAADRDRVGSGSLLASPMGVGSSGEALTEENVGKLEEESALVRGGRFS